MVPTRQGENSVHSLQVGLVVLLRLRFDSTPVHRQAQDVETQRGEALRIALVKRWDGVERNAAVVEAVVEDAVHTRVVPAQQDLAPERVSKDGTIDVHAGQCITGSGGAAG